MVDFSHPSLQVEAVEGTALVRFTHAVLDADSLRGVLSQLVCLCEAGQRQLHLDLSGVTCLTAGGLGQLVALHKATRAEGGRLVLVNVAPRLYEIFAVTHLTEVLDIREASAKSVMVVEDDATTRDALKTLLERQGYSVACAADGQEALDHLRHTEPPSVILLDLMMDGMDGWQFRKEQRRDPALSSIPVVIVTATDDVPGSAASLGAAGYLRKPVEFSRLLEVVREQC